MREYDDSPFPWQGYRIAMALIIAFVVLPVVSVLCSMGIAAVTGCQVHEGFPNPCLVLGADIGEMLYGMFVAGWLLIATVPLGIVAVVVWLIVLFYHRRSW